MDKLKVLKLKKKESANAKLTLSDYLKRAEAGEITAMAVVILNDDGSIRSDYSVDKYIHLDTLVGALAHLEYRILSENVDGE